MGPAFCCIWVPHVLCWAAAHAFAPLHAPHFHRGQHSFILSHPEAPQTSKALTQLCNNESVVGAAGSGQSVLEWLLAEAPDLALTAVGTGVAALWWPDSDSGAKATAFCRCAPAVCTA